MSACECNSMGKVKTFDALRVSSKFGICGLPLAADTYKGTSCFDCRYCEAKDRQIMPTSDTLAVANMEKMEKTLERVLGKGILRPDNLLDALLVRRMTIHLGSMSDPLQPCEAQYHITRAFIELTKQYGLPVLLSSKTADTFGIEFDPSLHAFQLSISNIDNRKDIEPGVPDIEDRMRFFKDLKRRGFRVGIRLQPYIPGVSNPEVVDMFRDADHFVVEGIKIVPQDKEYVATMLELLGLQREDFVLRGLLQLDPELRLKAYAPLIERFERYGLSYSIADNDLRYLGNNICCCGDALSGHTHGFDTTAMIQKCGIDYTKDDLVAAIRKSGCAGCKAKSLFASNRQKDGETVEEILANRYERKCSPSSPKHQYRSDHFSHPENR